MLSFKLIFFSVLCLTLISGATATWLAMTGHRLQPSRKKVAERFALIAFFGATASFSLLGKLEST